MFWIVNVSCERSLSSHLDVFRSRQRRHPRGEHRGVCGNNEVRGQTREQEDCPEGGALEAAAPLRVSLDHHVEDQAQGASSLVCKIVAYFLQTENKRKIILRNLPQTSIPGHKIWGPGHISGHKSYLVTNVASSL